MRLPDFTWSRQTVYRLIGLVCLLLGLLLGLGNVRAGALAEPPPPSPTLAQPNPALVPSPQPVANMPVYRELTPAQTQAWAEVALRTIQVSPSHVPILEFHNVGRYNIGRFYVQPLQLDSLLTALEAQNYRLVNLATYRDYLAGKVTLDHAVMLTFDDGHEEHFSVVRPILQKHKAPGMFFVVSGYANSKFFLSPAQIKQMSDEGFDMCGHSLRHEAANRRLRSDAQILDDYKTSKAKLEEWTGKTITTMAYPYGTFDAQVEKLSAQAGFDLSFAAWEFKGQLSDRMAIGRMEVRGDWTTAPAVPRAPPLLTPQPTVTTFLPVPVPTELPLPTLEPSPSPAGVAQQNTAGPATSERVPSPVIVVPQMIATISLAPIMEAPVLEVIPSATVAPSEPTVVLLTFTPVSSPTERGEAPTETSAPPTLAPTPTPLPPTATETPAATATLTPTATPVPTAAPLPAIRSFAITLPRQTVNVRVGETFQLDFPTGFGWADWVGNLSMLGRIAGTTPLPAAQRFYVARSRGSTTISATGEPFCRQGKPPCSTPSQQWVVTVVVGQ